MELKGLMGCPICHKAPSVTVKPIGSLQMWFAGCNAHFEDAAMQPSYENVVLQWNDFARQFPLTGGR